MRVFLSEYLTCGAIVFDNENAASLAIEGAAMLRVLAKDAAAVPNFEVEVIWNPSLPPFDVDGVRVHSSNSPSNELSLFRKLSREADATIVIAPEFDRILESRCRTVKEVGGRLVGSTPDAIALCSDKLALAAYLKEKNLPTIPTHACDFAHLKQQIDSTGETDLVVKPRCGAGSIDTFRIRSGRDVEVAARAFESGGTSTAPIVQPYIRGEALSIAAIIQSDRIELLPICRQHVTDSHEMHYLGGSVPCTTRCDEQIRETARRAIAAVPGLAGYIGLDILLPTIEASDREPLIVEINPRLTSSYHGYRQLAQENLAERMIAPGKDSGPIPWSGAGCEFLPDGTVYV